MKALTAFDRLDEVRSAARARAVEDFEFFCSGVLGLSLPSGICTEIQQGILQGREVRINLEPRRLEVQVERAIVAWRVVLGKSGEVVHGPSETFEWLFPEVARRAA